MRCFVNQKIDNSLELATQTNRKKTSVELCIFRDLITANCYIFLPEKKVGRVNCQQKIKAR